MCLCLQYVEERESVVSEALADKEVENLIRAHLTYSSRVLGLRRGQTAILSNGKVRVISAKFIIIQSILNQLEQMYI